MERDRQVLGQSGHFLDALEKASAAAPLERPVIVVGERGTGKALVAERLHRLSERWNGPFVTTSCAGLSPADLVGEDGPGTRARRGLLQLADGGTLVLEQVDELPPAAQLRLLRAMERGEVGERRPRAMDTRLVVTTDVHLPSLVTSGAMRADLLDRLAFVVITLPPLRDRGGDALLIAHHYGRRMAAELGREVWRGWGEEAQAQLTAHLWPGNLRELQLVVERSVAAWTRPDEPVDALLVDPFDSPWRPKAPAPPAVPSVEPPDAAPPSDLRAATNTFERQAMEESLARCRHNGRAAAKALGLTYDQFRHTARKHGLL